MSFTKVSAQRGAHPRRASPATATSHGGQPAASCSAAAAVGTPPCLGPAALWPPSRRRGLLSPPAAEGDPASAAAGLGCGDALSLPPFLLGAAEDDAAARPKTQPMAGAWLPSPLLPFPPPLGTFSKHLARRPNR